MLFALWTLQTSCAMLELFFCRSEKGVTNILHIVVGHCAINDNRPAWHGFEGVQCSLVEDGALRCCIWNATKSETLVNR
jgi:hypothetical protein